MSDPSQHSTDLSPQLSEPEATELLQALRRKQGTWVEWGQACQRLQKAGYDPQAIFEATGFEPIHQNQIIVAAQVYASAVSAGLSQEAQTYYQQRGSDQLYELRVLTQAERALTADFLFTKQLDADAAKEVVKAVKDYSRLTTPPEGFSDHPGDRVAYSYWRLARQQADLQVRSRLIAKAFSVVFSEPARQQIEKLLTDFSVTPTREPPFLPIYRLETEENLPRMVPLAGQLPLTIADLQAVPIVEPNAPFNWVKFSGDSAWVALPGWQIILNAEDPVAILCRSDQVPIPVPGPTEPLLVVIDRTQRDWDVNSYYLYEDSGQVCLNWFEEQPEQVLLGRVILMMRPKKVLDENYTKDPWQIDE